MTAIVSTFYAIQDFTGRFYTRHDHCSTSWTPRHPEAAQFESVADAIARRSEICKYNYRIVRITKYSWGWGSEFVV